MEKVSFFLNEGERKQNQTPIPGKKDPSDGHQSRGSHIWGNLVHYIQVSTPRSKQTPIYCLSFLPVARESLCISYKPNMQQFILFFTHKGRKGQAGYEKPRKSSCQEHPVPQYAPGLTIYVDAIAFWDQLSAVVDGCPSLLCHGPHNIYLHSKIPRQPCPILTFDIKGCKLLSYFEWLK